MQVGPNRKKKCLRGVGVERGKGKFKKLLVLTDFTLFIAIKRKKKKTVGARRPKAGATRQGNVHVEEKGRLL